MIDEFGVRRCRLAAMFRSALLVLPPFRGTATDARLLPPPEPGSCVAGRLLGVMRVRSPEVVRPPLSPDGRDAAD
jgi:hypothetical protein